MTQDQVQANVVLSADNSQYDQAMDQSAQSTARLGKQVDSLGQKIDHLTKSAGKKMFGLSLADVGLIGAATAAWASYEKQMQNLTAQAAVVSRTQQQQQKTMSAYTASVKNLRGEFGLTTSAAATLTQTISKMPTVSTGQLKGLTTIFEQMALATGESSENLASSVLNLQSVMATPINSTTTRQYADTLTYLAAKSNTSASALADFASQMAPMGKAMGMTGTQVIGLANMFTKAGQEGYTAASAATKVMQDITYATKTGSPQLNQYANLLGVTVDHFKHMTAVQQVAGFFDSINKLGPQSSLVLQQFGFDGIRMSRAIQAAVQSSGGAMNSIQEAQAAAASGSTAKGADATDNLVNNLQKVRQELQMTAESFATVLGPGVNAVVVVIDKLAAGFNALMSGPFGKFAQILAAIMVPLTAVTGGLLLMATAFTKVMAVATVARSSIGYGVREGIKGGPSIVREMAIGPSGEPVWTGGYVGAGGRTLGARGAELAEMDPATGMPRSSWAARAGYNYGQRLGGGLRAGYEGVTGLPIFVGGAGGGPSPASRGVAWTAQQGGRLFRSQFDQLRFQNVTERDRFFRQYFGGRGPEVAQMQDARIAAEQRVAQLQIAHQALMSAPTGAVSAGTMGASAKAVQEAEQNLAKLQKAEEALVVAARAQVTAKDAETAATKQAVGATEALKTESAAAAKALAEAGVAAGKFAAGAMVDTAKMGAGAAAGPLKSLLGGAFGFMGGGPGLAMMGLMAAPFIIPAVSGMFAGHDYKPQNLGTPGQGYLGIAGTSAATTSGVGYQQAKPTTQTATTVTRSTMATATAPGYKLSDPNLAKLSQAEVIPYLSQNWSKIKGSPNALAALRDDLTNTWGGQFAQQTLDTLMAGGTQGLQPQAFFAAAQGPQGPVAYDIYGSLQQQQIANVAQAHGAPAMFGARGRALAQGLGQYITASYNPVGGGTTGAMAGGAGDALLNAIKTATGVDISSSDMSRLLGTVSMQANMTAMPGQPGWQQTLKARQFLGTQGAGYASMTDAQRLAYMLPMLPSDAQQQIANQLGVAPGVTGANMVAQVQKILQQRGGQPYQDTESIGYRIGQLGVTGQMFMQNRAVTQAVGFGAQGGQMNNIPATVTAINSMMEHMTKLGMSAPQITKAMGDIQSTVGDPNDPKYIMANYISGQAQQDFATKMSMMPRGQAFQAQVNMFQQQMAIKPVTAEQFQQQQADKQQMVSSMVDQVNYFRQLDLNQMQYDINRKREQDDYHQQQMWQEQDYQIMRSREEQQYNLQRTRQLQAYHIQVQRAWTQFYLQRQRAEEDFNHQTEVEAKQMADSVYSVYQRVQVERTSSAEWTLANAADQLQRMREQERDLKAMRAEGLSTAAIQMLGLTDPAQQQQLARDRVEFTKTDIAQANQLAQARLTASKADITDPSNPDYQERMYQRHTSMVRSREDMNTQMKYSHDDLMRNLRQTAHDFNVLEDQQAADHKRALERNGTIFSTTMARQAQDLANQAKELDMTLQQTLTYAVNHLTGHAQQQAIAVQKAFGDLKTPTTQQAASIMKELGQIFGFSYTVPKGIREGWRLDAQRKEAPYQDPGTRYMTSGVQWGAHEGGIVPGWSPNKDDRMIAVGGGEAVMRPEWVRAVGEETINRLNHQAKHGGFADGGVYRPINTGVTRGLHDAWTGYTALDFGTPVGTTVYAVAPGSITKSYDIAGPLPTDTYHNAAYGPYGSYGRVMYVALDRGPTVLYAHLSTRGYAAGTRVKGGEPIGLSGSSGNSSGPHLHFGDSDGNPYEFVTNALAPHGLFMGAGVGGDSFAGNPSAGGGVVSRHQIRQNLMRRINKVLSSFYRAPEEAALNMQGIRPLDPGQISTVINRVASARIDQLINQYGLPGSGSKAAGLSAIASAPANVTGNVALGKKMAAAVGWTGNEWNALYQLWQHESGWRTNAANPSSAAYGIPQSNPGSKMASVGADWRTNPATQIQWGLSYIRQHPGYGTPSRTWALWQQRDPHWYGSGGVFSGAQTIGVGESGPEAVIPLNTGGANFMAEVMAHTLAGRGTAAMRSGTQIYATRIDRSTNFTGPITVQANNPNELIQKLQARQRVMALSRPVLTGSAA